MYLQLNTRFNPFTYDEMVKPLLYYKQAYDATEAAYSDLATRAEQWKAIAESDDSPMAKAMYQNYSNDLSSVVSDFSTGMTASNRSALLDMRRRYSREIQPIEIAFKRRAQLDDEQRKVMASDPTMLYQRRANEMSLDDFIKNPSLDYGQGYSGAMLTKQVAQAASGMAKEARDSAEGRRKLRALLPYQYELIQQNGFSRDAVMKAIMNSPDADRILTGLVDNAVSSSGVLDWGDKDTISRAYDYARQGLWSAIGDTKTQVITDSYGMQSQLAMDRKGSEAPSVLPREPQLFGPRVISGVGGKVNKELEVLDGLRQTPNGYSTNRIDQLKKSKENIEEELSRYSEDELASFRDYRRMKEDAGRPSTPGVGSYMTLGKIMSTSTTPTPRGYADYSKLHKKYEEVQKELNEETNKIDALLKRYSHLGGTPYESLAIGKELERLQQSQEITSFPLSIEDTQYNKVRKGIGNLMNSLSKETIESGTVGFVDADGESLSYKETKKILDDIGNSYIKVSGGNNPKLVVVHDNKEYSIKGVEQLDNYNRDLQSTNNFLKDFSVEGITPYITPISDATLREIYTNGVESARISDINIQPIPGSRYSGTVLYNPTSGEYIKIMVDKNGRPVAANSLRDELLGGRTRDEYFIKMANAGLGFLPELVAR